MRRFAVIVTCGWVLAPAVWAFEDCNGNGRDDAVDVSSGSSADLNQDGVPDECQRCALLESWRLTAPTPAASDRFAFALDLDGDVALFGAPFRDTASGDSGAANVYQYANGAWQFRSELRAADGASFDHFGNAVALSGNVAAVGTPDDDNGVSNTGSVYLFRNDGAAWSFEAKLTPPDPQFNARFGDPVCLRGDLLLVGAVGADSLSGAVYAYQYSGGAWNLVARLVSNDRSTGDRFGQRMALDDGVAVIAAPQDDDNGSNSGSAYVFRFANGAWTQEAKLRAADAAASDLFGSAVAVRGDRVVVGSPADDDGGSNAGSVYTFAFANGIWAQTDKLTAFDRAAGDNFGEAVALDVERLAVAAVGDDDRGSNSGSVYLYERSATAWRLTAKFAPSDGQPGNFIGSALALDGDVALIGAWEDDAAGFASGAAYSLHNLDDCNGDGRVDLCGLQAGSSTDANTNGVPDECDPDCNANGAPDDLDVASGESNDCNGNGTPDECEIASGAAQDCNQNGVPDACDLATGASADCDGNGVPDGCDVAAGAAPDCNQNGVPDACDLARGTSADCNGNGVPDGCDLASGFSADCNENGVPDECDTAAGTSADCDGDNSPDECAGDADGDGVIDGCDQCPNTPGGTAVNADGCPVVPPMSDLGLTSVCANRPGVERRWRVSNPNVGVVAVQWSVDGTAQVGMLDAPPGDSYFTTETVDGPNVASIKWSDPMHGIRSVAAESTAGACPGPDSDGDGVPDADDWCPDTRRRAAVDEHGCAAGQQVAVCHTPRGNPAKRETIYVAPAAVRAHLRHGDSLGPCEQNNRGDKDRQEPLPRELQELLEGQDVKSCGAGAAGMLPLMALGFVAGKVQRRLQRQRAGGGGQGGG